MNRTINFIFRVVARREESFFVQDALVPNANQAKCFILSLRKHFWIEGDFAKDNIDGRDCTLKWGSLGSSGYVSGVVAWLLEILISQVAANWPIKT